MCMSKFFSVLGLCLSISYATNSSAMSGCDASSIARAAQSALDQAVSEPMPRANKTLATALQDIRNSCNSAVVEPPPPSGGTYNCQITTPDKTYLWKNPTGTANYGNLGYGDQFEYLGQVTYDPEYPSLIVLQVRIRYSYTEGGPAPGTVGWVIARETDCSY
jgi:hypothetical protein